MKKAEEVAREMVTHPKLDMGVWRVRIEDAVDWVCLEYQPDHELGGAIADDARGILARLYERAYADGYAAGKADGVREERERFVGTHPCNDSGPEVEPFV